MLNILRRKIFWLNDRYKGGFVKEAYDDIRFCTETNSPAENNIIGHKEEPLRELLNHAVETTAYYNGYKGLPLSNFPVVNKAIIKEHQEEFLSSSYKSKKLIEMSTSGSTGMPFTCYQNIEKKKRVNAETLYFNGQAGYEVGNRFIFLRSLTDKSKKSWWTQWLQNEKLIDTKELEDKKIEEMLADIKRASSKEPCILVSYASTYDAFAKYFRERGTDMVRGCNICGIISSSEILFDDTRKSMMEAFKCDCFSRYANMENGMLGQDIPEQPNIFVINEADYLIEILKMDKDIPADEGEIGRVVVTDLYNKAMPLIRYDTGDVGAITFVERKGAVKRAISAFGGRKIDMIYDSHGGRVSPHKISVSFWEFSELKQYQFIQEGRQEYKVKINVDAPFSKDKELINKLKLLLGEEANITLEEVKEIPVLASGKRKYIMNNYN